MNPPGGARNFSHCFRVPSHSNGFPKTSAPSAPQKGAAMGGEIIGLVAVVMGLGIPLGAMYTYYRVRKLRSEERIAAMARGVDIPMQPELTQVARSRRWGILLVSGAIGYILTFALIAQIEHEPETWVAARSEEHT